MDLFLETAKDTGHVLSPTDEDTCSGLLRFLEQRSMEHVAKDISLDLSLVRFDENKQVTGCMLLQELDE